MRAITAFILDHSKAALWFFIVLALAAGLLIPFSVVNYDLSQYLPPDSQSRAALDLLRQEFGYQGFAYLMAEDISPAQALALKAGLQDVEGVASVLWLDDVADLNRPLAFIDPDYLDAYYKDGKALFTLSFVQDDYSLVTGEALVRVRDLARDFDPAIYGTAEESRHTRAQMTRELVNIMLVIVPVCMLILIAIANSWFEPVLYIFVICVAVLLNMGSNLIFPSVSYIIFSMGAAIQLAVSMDYSLFLSHRFEEERARGSGVREAIITATQKTFPAIAASALTTVAGFSALALLDYGIGRDIGLVLAKGVALSFACVIFFLPPLLLRCHRLVERTRHKALLFFTPALGRAVVAPRYLLLALTAPLVLLCAFAQQDTHFLYGDSSGSAAAGQYAAERDRISQTFPICDQLVLLFPSGEESREIALAQEAAASPYVESVQALVTLADPVLPRGVLPAAVRESFDNGSLARMIVNVNTVTENGDMFACVDFLQDLGQKYYPDQWGLVGKAASIGDIRKSTTADLQLTLGFSLAAVALIILFTFKSLLLPLLLVLVIQGAIYINMAVPYFTGVSMVFIGYIVVSSLQLGATIDYAILTTSRYLEARQSLLPAQAAAEAVRRSGISVTTSALILAVAGAAEALMSNMEAVSAIGVLICRGAILSLLLVLFVLPGLLTAGDGLIQKTTLGCRLRQK